MRKNGRTRNSGYTLIELLIVMVIFIVVIIISSSAFNTALTQTKKVSKSEESNIEGVIGLEMFRHDLEQAGFGLVTEFDTIAPDYLEADGTRAALYNDAPHGLPRAVVAGNNISGDAGVLAGTDYLAIKATTVGLNKTTAAVINKVCQRWTYINGLSPPKLWEVSNFVDNFVGNDYVIAIQQSYKNGELHRKLIYNADSFSVKYKDLSGSFVPQSEAVLYYYYGIYYDSDDVKLRAPFNRTDYFVNRASSTPSSCAPGAGVLYKTVMNQNSGSMSDFSFPIIDCVADMQVVFGWDTAGNGLDTYTDADMSTTATSLAWTPSLSDPSDIRKHLKLIKVYILVQDGGKDLSYINTETAMPVGIACEANTLAHTINLTGPNYQNYRWKLYRIVVRPKNLM